MPLQDQGTTRRRFLGYFSSAGLAPTLLPGVLWARVQEQRALRITAEMLRDALAVAGLEFTEEERQAMVEGLNQNLEGYEENRRINLDDTIGLPTYYSPLVPGTKLDRQPRPFRRSLTPDVQRPSNLEDVAFWPIAHLASLIETRQVTSVELAQMYLARIRKHNPSLNCVVTITDDLALEQARQADREISSGQYRGLLHGVPWGCKDIFAVPGYPTTWGSNAFKDQVLEEEATVVRLLREAGAVLLAKLATGELAAGDRWFGGRTNNPWHVSEGAAGSSTGSGSATAAGLVAFAIGTETSRSILNPSTRCGVTGLRPTFGRVSRHGVMVLSWTRDRVGPMCRTAEDCAIVFHAIAKPDEHDLSVIDLPFNWDADLDVRRLRVGYLAPAFEEHGRGEDRTRNDQQVLDQLESLGIELEPFELPQFPNPGGALGVESAAFFDQFLRSGRTSHLTNQNRANGMRRSRLVPAVEYLQAQRIRMIVMRQFADVVSRFDVYVAPYLEAGTGSESVGGSLPPSSVTHQHFQVANLCGYPAVSVPNGFLTDGRPTSITFLGRLYAEAEVLAVAKAYQDASGWHNQHPQLT